MPYAAPSPCTYPGCSVLVGRGRRCPLHNPSRSTSPVYRGSSAQQGYGPEWRRLRARLLPATCAVPGCGRPATDIDHRLARRRGGTDDISNLRPLCHSHHSRKTADEDGGWGNRVKVATRG